MIVQILLNGIIIGMTYALVAMGLSLVFGVMGILNVGHGDFIILGSVLTYVIFSQAGLPPYAGLFVAGLAGAAVGALTQGVLLERIRKAQPLMSLLLLFGVGTIIAQSATLYVGTGFFSVPYWQESLTVANIRVPHSGLFALAAALLTTIGLFYFLSRTNYGRSIRATSQEPELAAAVGVNTRSVRILSFAIGGALAAISGALLITAQGLSTLSGPVFLMIAFAACILGGLGSVQGAMIAGVLIGLVEVTAASLVDIQFGQLAIFAIFLLILLFRPQGILGIKRRTV